MSISDYIDVQRIMHALQRYYKVVTTPSKSITCLAAAAAAVPIGSVLEASTDAVHDLIKPNACIRGFRLPVTVPVRTPQ